MAYETDIRGYEQSGGWRYPYTGRQSSTDAFYGGQSRLDPQKLAALANGQPSQGLLDQALTQPAQQAQGLLTGYTGGGGREDQGLNGVGGITGAAPGSHSGTNTLSGSGTGFAGKAAGAVIGGLLGGVPGAQLGMKAADFLGNFAGNFGTPGVENGYGALGGGGLGVASEATGPGTIGARDTYGSNESPAMTAAEAAQNAASMQSMSDALAADAAAQNAAYGYSGDYGGYSGGGYGSDTSGANGGDNTGGGGAMGGDRGDSGFAKGGHVQKQSLFGPNPKGKDDGYAALDAGEFVLKSDAVKRIGTKALKALNEGRAKIVMIKKGA